MKWTWRFGKFSAFRYYKKKIKKACSEENTKDEAGIPFDKEINMGKKQWHNLLPWFMQELWYFELKVSKAEWNYGRLLDFWDSAVTDYRIIWLLMCTLHKWPWRWFRGHQGHSLAFNWPVSNQSQGVIVPSARLLGGMTPTWQTLGHDPCWYGQGHHWESWYWWWPWGW